MGMEGVFFADFVIRQSRLPLQRNLTFHVLETGNLQQCAALYAGAFILSKHRVPGLSAVIHAAGHALEGLLSSS